MFFEFMDYWISCDAILKTNIKLPELPRIKIMFTPLLQKLNLMPKMIK